MPKPVEKAASSRVGGATRGPARPCDRPGPDPRQLDRSCYSRVVLRDSIATATITLALIAACKPTEETNLPICKAEVAGGEAEEVASGEVPPDIWFTILLQN